MMNNEDNTAESSALDDDFWIERTSVNSLAFQEMYHQYFPKIYRYVYRRVNDRCETEELTAVVFFSAIEGIVNGKYTHRGKFAAWLFTIARTKIADHFREQAKHPMLELSDESINGSIVDIQEKQEDRPGDRDLLFKNSDLESAFSELTKYEQDLLALRFSAELDFTVIASVLRKNTAAVKMAAYRALEKLRSHLEGLHDQE